MAPSATAVQARTFIKDFDLNSLDFIHLRLVIKNKPEPRTHSVRMVDEIAAKEDYSGPAQVTIFLQPMRTQARDSVDVSGVRR
jgi:hypothetical protein